MVRIGCPETSVRNYHYVLCNIPEEGSCYVKNELQRQYYYLNVSCNSWVGLIIPLYWPKHVSSALHNKQFVLIMINLYLKYLIFTQTCDAEKFYFKIHFQNRCSKDLFLSIQGQNKGRASRTAVRDATLKGALRRHWNNRKHGVGELRFSHAKEFLRKLFAIWTRL